MRGRIYTTSIILVVGGLILWAVSAQLLSAGEGATLRELPHTVGPEASSKIAKQQNRPEDTSKRSVVNGSRSLSTYSVEEDTTGTVVRIPIDRAMNVLLEEEAFPVRENPRVPARTRFSESGYFLTSDSLPPSLTRSYDYETMD